MLAFSMFTWWYGQGWARIGRSLPKRLRAISSFFSVSALLRTLFAPWRRTITPPGRSIGEHFRAAVNNIVSRFVGLLVRLTVLLTATVALVVLIGLSLVELVAWPMLPLAIIVLVVKGFAG